jgi:hypothetical protein
VRGVAEATCCSISRKRPGWGSTREGRIVRMQTFTERKKALEAAGLSE